MHIMWINEIADLTGGCERYIADTAVLLQEIGHRNTLLYGVEGWTEPKFMKIFDQAFPMVDLSRQIKEIDPDLIYVQRLTGSKPLKELIASGKPVIRFFHDHKLFCLREHKYTVLGHKTCTQPIGLRCYSCLGFINRKAGFPGIRFTSLASFKKELKANKQLAAYVVGSKYMKKHLIAHGFRTNKIHVNQLFSTSSIKSIQEDKKDLLFAGQLVRGKGIDLMLQALAQIKTDHKLIICGSGRQEAEYKELSAKLGLEKRVIWKGKVPREELDMLYASALCFLMPSRVPETFGLSGLEAMSCGTPVIAADVGGISEWLQDGETGLLVPPNDVNALVKAINNLLADNELRQKMAEKGQKKFKEKFMPEYHMKRLISIFENAISD